MNENVSQVLSPGMLKFNCFYIAKYLFVSSCELIISKTSADVLSAHESACCSIVSLGTDLKQMGHWTSS